MIPVILSVSEVRAALAGTLTELRRPIKPQPDPRANHLGGAQFCDGDHPSHHGCEEHAVDLPCPVGAPGSLLYVCEAWAAHWMYDDVPPDEARSTRPNDNRWYQADGDAAPSHLGLLPYGYRGQWRSAESMPVWASRFAYRVRGGPVTLAGGVWTWASAVERVNKPNGAPMPPVEVSQADAAHGMEAA